MEVVLLVLIFIIRLNKKIVIKNKIRLPLICNLIIRLYQRRFLIIQPQNYNWLL